MAYALYDERVLHAIEKQHGESAELEAVPASGTAFERDSLSENFHDELEAWARHALARNGFGDY